MKEHFKEKGFCYFAVDKYKLEANEFIGFIELVQQNHGTNFPTCKDIG
jgi:hypothetical protein